MHYFISAGDLDYNRVSYLDRLALVQSNDTDFKCIDIVTNEDDITEGLEEFDLSLVVEEVPYSFEVTIAVAQVVIIDNESKFWLINLEFNPFLRTLIMSIIYC